jgi:hypothetical protein
MLMRVRGDHAAPRRRLPLRQRRRRQEQVIDVTSRMCRMSPTDRFTAPGAGATIQPSSHLQPSGSVRHD